MNKYLLCAFLSLVLFCTNCFGQTPALNSYTDSITDYFVFLSINYTANDTGVIKAQIQIEQGAGAIRYDSIFRLSAAANTATLAIGPLYYCASYSSFLFNTSNSHGYSPVTNLFSFNTLCEPSSIAEVTDNSFHFSVQNNTIQIQSIQLQPGMVADIYDLTGRKITAASLLSNTQQIKVNAGAGLYLLRIEVGGKSLYTSKFVIN